MPVKFCRHCGQDYCHVLRSDRRFLPHPIGIADSGDDNHPGYLMPTTAHIDPAWIMGYDLYPMDTLAYKKVFLREAIDREYVIFFEHDPTIAAGVIRERDGRRIVEPASA